MKTVCPLCFNPYDNGRHEYDADHDIHICSEMDEPKGDHE